MRFKFNWYSIKSMSSSTLTAFSIITTNPQASSAGIAVIANQSVSTSSISLATVKEIYLGKTDHLDNGKAVKAFNQEEGSPVWEEFSNRVLGKTGKQLKSYWSIQIFTGKGVPAQSLSTSAQVIEAVKNTPDSLGYIDAADVPANIKVIHKID